MINRSQTFKSMPVNITGSSIFGRYPKINLEKTYNMFISDGWMVPYAGYMTVLTAANSFGMAVQGRAIHTSIKLNCLIAIFDNRVYKITLSFNQGTFATYGASAVLIGVLETSTGVCYITENNKPQVVISDGSLIYYYDPTLSPAFQQAGMNTDTTPAKPLSFKPGYIDFHDNYIICAASNDKFVVNPPSNLPVSNTWRLGFVDNISGGTGKLYFPDESYAQGYIQTKPDNTQVAVRAPSHGNMIFVMGQTVTEPWYDTALQEFPYQRSSQFNIDYGCLNPATVASNDEIVVWLAQNEKSGPIIVYSDGSTPKKITTDGIDYLFSNMQNPADSRGFLYRQDGHLFYHINFYTDNVSLFYDFNTDKFYHACDQNGNYFIADQVAFYNNQYYFITKQNGNLYAFDTIFTTYDGLMIPRTRICAPIRLPSQEYFIANDVGFWIEQGETDYTIQDCGPIYLITQDNRYLITQGSAIFIEYQDDNLAETQNDFNLAYQKTDPTGFSFLIAQQDDVCNMTPTVALSISIDGGVSFSSEWAYTLNPTGRRKNKLIWWQLGAANEIICKFNYWGIGRWLASNGELNIRQ